ncbi:protein bicaudal D homolog 1-like isoform X2 [Xyrauchen texanus]|uniref:protein bicaudal D homolog 1-like isoform X2 n=1 Tax=Xyrauchen texanus TaxID=154827 RepID=UPI002241B5EA|nr:protein bicaudal D homolog 1-like isoform X2 [Xyrauchen texanus]
MAAGGGCGQSVDQYRAEVERLTRELAEANREKIRAAECGLVVLEENETLKHQYAELESEQDVLKHELEQLQEAFGQAYTNQRKVAEVGETNEEMLLQESASKEAYYTSRVEELQTQLKMSSSVASNAQTESEHLNTLLQELREVSVTFLKLRVTLSTYTLYTNFDEVKRSKCVCVCVCVCVCQHHWRQMVVSRSETVACHPLYGANPRLSWHKRNALRIMRCWSCSGLV